LHTRLDDNAAALLLAYRMNAAELESERVVVPAAEWLLDNYHLVEQQIREIRDDLPPGYYRQLPKLAEGPFAGYPRVFGLVWAFVAHTDSNFDPEVLRRFLIAYQSAQALTIGELWAVPITLRIVLIENLRRLAEQMAAGVRLRADADALTDRLLSKESTLSALDINVAARKADPLHEIFVAQLAKRLRDQDPKTTPALGWLEQRLKAHDTSIDDIVQQSHLQQGATNVTVRNIITSMRLISDIDWAQLFERVSLVDQRLRTGSAFATMDFPTRNLYRNAIEQLARGSTISELDIAELALNAAKTAASAARADGADATEVERLGDPGYHLIGGGRRALERTIGFHAPLRLRLSRLNIRLGMAGYIGAILAVTAVLLWLALNTLWTQAPGVSWTVAFGVLAFLPLTEVATSLVNRAIAWNFGAAPLPGLDLKHGVPASLRTLVATPTLIHNEADIREQVERLEVHYLASGGGDLTFALLSDGVDADQEVLPGDDALIAMAAQAIHELNVRYGPGPAGKRFLLLHRRRVFNPSENKWMGWERKRGKLHELNRLLRGADDTHFMSTPPFDFPVPDNVRYVITLDADTRLPRDTAVRLVGKIAHPLNRPKFDAAQQRVVDGHAILQPRVTPSLPTGRDGTLYQRVFSSPAGMDPYAAAVSDVYQDLFGEGSYTGKGIYDVDIFEAALAGRTPDNTLLSHDLFEGTYARSGLASDVEVVEEFPSRYDVDAKRHHRWTRGDWQLLPWLYGRRGDEMPSIGRGKMLDNFRRSLQAPSAFLALAVSFLLPRPANIIGAAIVVGCFAVPAFLPTVFSILPARAGIRFRSHLDTLAAALRLAGAQTFLSIAFLADHAWRRGDAIVRTLIRVYATRRRLLEWVTFAQSNRGPQPRLPDFYAEMPGGLALALAVAAITLPLSPSSWPLIVAFTGLWLAGPALAWWSSRPQVPSRRLEASENQIRELRLTARRTWRFFETFVTATDNMLPPDNFQETPKPIVAHRTSPTNIGLYLLSAVAARDFGWAGTLQTIERLEAAFASMRRLQQFEGHFFNWYDTLDLRPLDPQYVSSVDSGNLAGHLVALANACEEMMQGADLPLIRSGMGDDLTLARRAIDALPAANSERGRQLAAILDDIETQWFGAQTNQLAPGTLKRLAEKAFTITQSLIPAVPDDKSTDLLFWIEAIRSAVREHSRDRALLGEAPQTFHERLQTLADTAREMAFSMNFAFLLDPDRKLLSIGYSMTDNNLDASCYDLLASEARLASLFAIAKGDATTKHWLRLGRTSTPLGHGSALISWSGSMFEYLMPSLIMRAPAGSLLEQTNRLMVTRQQAYAKSLAIPWGISESAYNARDMDFTYQYSNFGVPGLGLKRGLADNVVIAPYATALASMVDPRAAAQNFERLAALGALGRYGFYEALDFTRSRLPQGQRMVVVRSFMAHHQGMTIVAIANALRDGQMRARFHREPMVQACELLLQERVPRDVAIARPRVEEMKVSGSQLGAALTTTRRLAPSTGAAPATQLLSNGSYTVMLTDSGAGYSAWRDKAVTRWREDPTRDHWGSFVFMRDMQNGNIWSATAQPRYSDAQYQGVVFAEDYAEFIRRDGTLSTTMDVLVSGEDDSEVRRVSLTNSSRRSRDIELTSYAELVLAAPATDAAHPAFSKMFVVTDYLPEFGALVATRRARTLDEPEIWAAHFAVVEGELIAAPGYETDRLLFIGRGRNLETAAAIEGRQPLSNTVGAVLDPIFSLRHCVRVAPGKVVRIAFWTVVADSHAQLIDLIDKHHDRSAYERAKTLAWTQAQVQLRHQSITMEEAADFQRLAAAILYADPRYRPPSNTISRGAGPQSGLWPYAVSGDLPIVLLRIDDVQDMAQVRQLLRAHAYWRAKRLAVDLLIINERASSYVQDLQIAIETAVRSNQSLSGTGKDSTPGAVHALRADMMSVEARALLQSVARIALIARRGPIAEQLARLPSPSSSPPPPRRLPKWMPAPTLTHEPELEFFNGFGGFDKNGREYVVILKEGQTTPAPWINVVANPKFGFQASADGNGYTWAENSRENQLTPWSNDPVEDPVGEAIYVADATTGALWSPTAHAIRDAGTYVARHGRGYCRYEHQAHDIALELLQYVSPDDPVKISRLTLHNRSKKPRLLSVTAYADWVLGTSRGATAPFIVTHIDEATGAMLGRNPWSIAFPGRIAFADLHGRQTRWTADRKEFLGRNGSAAAPAALLRGAPLSNTTGAGLDPCTVLQCLVELDADESVEVVWLLGQCASVRDAQDLVRRYRDKDLDAILAQVTAQWDARLGAVQVKTPDRSMDLMLNGWLLYQTLACRIWARSAFYQASGAYGFRDQLQDGMALGLTTASLTRAHLLRAASRQFTEGDVQHWWLPHSGQGVRTRISDDRVWLAFAAANYIATSHDEAILDEIAPFLEGPQLGRAEPDAFFQPMVADESGSLFEHCARGLDQCIELTGEHGLPLIGAGDWNDGMNEVGHQGRGESVWLGWLLWRTIALFAPLADKRDPERAQRWRKHADTLQFGLEQHAWDGLWYRRATFDDGSWLGSKESEECRIDSIAQSWAVLSGAADPDRAAQAMASLHTRLVNEEEQLALLFWPPFDKTSKDPGYIRGYPPGVRENGGQYTHAAMWAVLAFAKLGEADKAVDLFAMLNPINHALTPEAVQRYKVEPYVVAADIYSVAPHVGRGGWTWYTGAAGWMHQAGVNGILGIRREGGFLVLDPCIPARWPGFEATVNIESTRIDIQVRHPSGRMRGISEAVLDDAPVDCAEGRVRVALDGGTHRLNVSI
jgi:cyclic beta-1,2-glucan synthetase